uniref:Uncharacterized protein n=1 Tax=Siphoviridae sp. ctHip2 TaxID=2827830 RepID=A0A8S5RVW1_9CAUD|nr:MAG TPA: hypothetical protein [Siphoviridae sp. ctHip2]
MIILLYYIVFHLSNIFIVLFIIFILLRLILNVVISSYNQQ